MLSQGSIAFFDLTAGGNNRAGSREIRRERDLYFSDDFAVVPENLQAVANGQTAAFAAV